MRLVAAVVQCGDSVMQLKSEFMRKVNTSVAKIFFESFSTRL